MANFKNANNHFIGRTDELSELELKFSSPKSELIVVYGRRRIGKSKLIQKFCEDKPALLFEGLEGKSTSQQISHFQSQLQKQLNDRALGQLQMKGWDAALSSITQWLSKNGRDKRVIFFDEFQWMSASRSSLVSLLKYYWDNEWKQYPVM